MLFFDGNACFEFGLAGHFLDLIQRVGALSSELGDRVSGGFVSMKGLALLSFGMTWDMATVCFLFDLLLT